VINTLATNNILRVLPFVLAASILTSYSVNAQTRNAQPRKAIVQNSQTASGNLTFDVTARIGSTSADGKTSGPHQSFNAKVLISGKKARIETGQGEQRAVLLFTPPYIYRLLPTPKAGIRWKLDAKKGADFRDFDPKELLSNPSNIRTSLVKYGAKRVGSSKINGKTVDIYEVNKEKERISSAKAWIGRDNALPYRLEAKGQGVAIFASWKNYMRPQTLSPSLFTPPTNFRIRNVDSPPPLSGM
jgi:hypothetical protein